MTEQERHFWGWFRTSKHYNKLHPESSAFQDMQQAYMGAYDLLAKENKKLKIRIQLMADVSKRLAVEVNEIEEIVDSQIQKAKEKYEPVSLETNK